MRRKDLVRLLNAFLGEANMLGFEPDEVRAVVEENLDLWEKNGSPPDPDAF